jgi:hypothetical protein
MLAFAVSGMVACLFLTGCNVTFPKLPGGSVPPALTNVVPPIVVGPTQPAETNALADDLDLSTVRWHGPDIRQWPIAADLVAGNRGGEITLKTDLLKGAKENDAGVSGNAWAIVMCKDGQWHASTYEWLDYSRQSRTRWKAFDAEHWTSDAVKDAKQDSGTEFYVAVSTFSRGTKRSPVDARTPFRKVVVP